MLAEIFLPAAIATSAKDAGAAVDAGPLGDESIMTDWLAFSGDHVHMGKVLGHAEIGGVATDITAPATGVLHILAPVDRPLAGLGLLAVIDTAPDARSFTVTFTPAEPPVAPANPAPGRLEWTVDLPPATPWNVDRLSASSLASSPRLGDTAPTAVLLDDRLERQPDPPPRAWDHLPRRSGGQDATRPLAARLPLLSRHIAASPPTREPAAQLPTEMPTEMPTELPIEPAPAAEPPATVPPPAPPGILPMSEVPERAPLPAVTTSSPPIPAPRERLYASPRARALARLMGVDVISVKGSGPFGRVEEEDVRQYLGAGRLPGLPATPPAGSEPASPAETDAAIIIETTAILITEDLASATPREPLPTETTATVSAPEPVEPTTEYLAPTETAAPEPAPAYVAPKVSEPPPLESPAFGEPDSGQCPPIWQSTATITVQVDATNLLLMRDRLTAGIQKRTGEPLSLDIMLARLVALTLRDYPALNARHSRQGFQTMPNLNLGLTTDTLPGLPVLVLTDAGSQDLLTLSREAALQGRRAASSDSVPANPQPASFTIIDLGSYGVDICTPAAQHPQCAALGLGRLAPRPMVLEGQIVVRATIFLSLGYVTTCVSAGQAAAFLRGLAALVEDPAPLAEGMIY